jgi:hypothetical protein
MKHCHILSPPRPVRLSVCFWITCVFIKACVPSWLCILCVTLFYVFTHKYFEFIISSCLSLHQNKTKSPKRLSFLKPLDIFCLSLAKVGTVAQACKPKNYSSPPIPNFWYYKLGAERFFACSEDLTRHFVIFGLFWCFYIFSAIFRRNRR